MYNYYYSNLLVLKWIADGCKTLKDVVKTLRCYADWIEKIERAGAILACDVDNGYIEIKIPKDKLDNVAKAIAGDNQNIDKVKQDIIEETEIFLGEEE